MTSRRCVVLVTTPNREKAEAIADRVLEEKLAACVQMTEIKSYYMWKGAVHRDPEILMIMKTRTALYPELEALVATHHDYEVPQIVQVPIDGGLASYLNWIDEVTRQPPK